MIQEITPDDLQKLQTIYERSFPEEERRPWEDILSPCSHKGPNLKVLKDDQGAVVGLLTYWTFERFIYIEHFAVDQNSRGRGLGSSALDQFIDSISLPLVLEVEKPEKGEMAKRRIGFYRRHGFEVVARNYIQPPYAPGLPSVSLDLMSTSAEVEVADVIRLLHGEVYSQPCVTV